MAKKSGKRSPRHSDEGFGRLFWTARKAYLKLNGSSPDSDPDHLKAIKFAKVKGWAWAMALLETSFHDFASTVDEAALDRMSELEDSVPARWRGLYHFVYGSALVSYGRRAEGIIAYRRALDCGHFDRPGYVWRNLGDALLANGEHDAAIAAYQTAYKDPTYENRAELWVSIGMALSEKGEFDQAIESYRTALNDPTYEAPADAWINIGVAYADKGDHVSSIDAYKQALAVSKGQEVGYSWSNIGASLSMLGKYDEAIEAYQKALTDPNFDRQARTYANLAEAYVEIGARDDAEIAFKHSLSAPDHEGSDHARARLGLQLLESRITPDALSPDDLALVAKPTMSPAPRNLESRLPDSRQIEDEIIAAISLAGNTQYEKYLYDKKDSGRDNVLSVLRGWSSAVTLLEGSERRWRGGGYFLKWRGCGVVIDPGFDFLRNFHDAGYHGREIRLVVVSHNHPDHNSEVKHIDDLRYELYKRLANTKKAGGEPYVLLWDEDTFKATTFEFQAPQHRHPPIVSNTGYPQTFELTQLSPDLPISVTPFKVTHGKDVEHATGMVINLLDDNGLVAVRIGYTGDTAYFPELKASLQGCDILIAHISQPSIEELKDASKLKEVHLGYRGTARLLSETNPRLALIGEFWAGLADLRIRLVKGLRQRAGISQVFPAGLSMHVKLPSLEIECTECNNPISFDKVKVAPPTDSFGALSYLCPDCMIE